jgi:predicted ArsR family transcriptional regulator
MGSMKDLLGDRPYGELPGFKVTGPSKEAAHAIAGRSGTLRERVLAMISRYPGSTADEIAEVIGETVLACRPRLSELKKLGLIEPTGERGKNVSGQSAHKWRVKNAA